MHKLDDLKTGDIGMTHDKGFLPKSIRYFMNMYAKKFHGKKLDRYYNHTFIILRKRDGIYIIESRGKGMEGTIITEKFSNDYIKNNILFARPSINFNKIERANIIDTIFKLSMRAIRYQFSNFIFWVIYIITKGNINLLRNSKVDRAFCFELSIHIWNKVRGSFRFNPPTTSTVDIQLDNRIIKFTIDSI